MSLRHRFTGSGLVWLNRVSGAVILGFGVAALVSLLAAAARAVRPGGLLVLETINPGSPKALRNYFADKSKAHREARYSEARIHRAGDKIFGTFRVTGIDAQGKAFDRYGIDLYEIKDGKISLKDSYLKAD